MNSIIIKESSNIKARFILKSPELNNSNGKITPILGKFPMIAPSQVHKSNIITVTKENFKEYALPNVIESDGIFLKTSEAEAMLRFADCAPVLIFPDDEWASKNFSYAMLLHSGFKGTVLNIVGKSLDLLKNISDEALKSANLWCGPCISQDDYPRDFDEWTEKALEKFSVSNVKTLDKKYYFDIKNEIKNQALKSGLNPEKIFISEINTFRDYRCYSYRRGDKFNRMILHVKIF